MAASGWFGSDQLGLERVWVMGDVLPPDRAYGRDNVGPTPSATVLGTTTRYCFLAIEGQAPLLN
jgi:hypothetical protein